MRVRQALLIAVLGATACRPSPTTENSAHPEQPTAQQAADTDLPRHDVRMLAPARLDQVTFDRRNGDNKTELVLSTLDAGCSPKTKTYLYDQQLLGEAAATWAASIVQTQDVYGPYGTDHADWDCDKDELYYVMPVLSSGHEHLPLAEVSLEIVKIGPQPRELDVTLQGKKMGSPHTATVTLPGMKSHSMMAALAASNEFAVRVELRSQVDENDVPIGTLLVFKLN